MAERLIHLNAFENASPVNISSGLWRHPEDQSHRYKDIRYWIELAQMLEGAGFDSIFMADVLGMLDVYQGKPDAALRTATQVPINDPTVLVSAMAAATKHIGFAMTVSLTYEQPYAFARTMTSLDHASDGRVGWNIVTSYLDSAARNLGRGEQMSHDERYDRGDEFMEVLYKLWEGSWEDDAVVIDKAKGIYVDPAKVHAIGHQGKYFQRPRRLHRRAVAAADPGPVPGRFLRARPAIRRDPFGRRFRPWHPAGSDRAGRRQCAGSCRRAWP